MVDIEVSRDYGQTWSPLKCCKSIAKALEIHGYHKWLFREYALIMLSTPKSRFNVFAQIFMKTREHYTGMENVNQLYDALTYGRRSALIGDQDLLMEVEAIVRVRTGSQIPKGVKSSPNFCPLGAAFKSPATVSTILADTGFSVEEKAFLIEFIQRFDTGHYPQLEGPTPAPDIPSQTLVIGNSLGNSSHNTITIKHGKLELYIEPLGVDPANGLYLALKSGKLTKFADWSETAYTIK